MLNRYATAPVEAQPRAEEVLAPAEKQRPLLLLRRLAGKRSLGQGLARLLLLLLQHRLTARTSLTSSRPQSQPQSQPLGQPLRMTTTGAMTAAATRVKSSEFPSLQLQAPSEPVWELVLVLAQGAVAEAPLPLARRRLALHRFQRQFRSQHPLRAQLRHGGPAWPCSRSSTAMMTTMTGMRMLSLLTATTTMLVKQTVRVVVLLLLWIRLRGCCCRRRNLDSCPLARLRQPTARLCGRRRLRRTMPTLHPHADESRSCRHRTAAVATAALLMANFKARLAALMLLLMLVATRS